MKWKIKYYLITEYYSICDFFHKPGIAFKDITPLLNDKHLLELTSMLVTNLFCGQEDDHLAGVESREFLFGTNLARDLQADCIPIQKQSKLPAETKRAE